MKSELTTPKKPKRNIPRSKENAFNIGELSMHEFEAFMILLIHEGIEQSIFKNLIDLEFNLKIGTTKGYDYINKLCEKGFAYKKKQTVDGKKGTRLYVKSTIRKKYEKFILPTIKNLDDSLNVIIKEYIEGITEEEKVREKFKTYTETIISALNKLITDTSAKTLNSQRFQKKINDTIWKYFRSEILKYEVFSK